MMPGCNNMPAKVWKPQRPNPAEVSLAKVQIPQQSISCILTVPNMEEKHSAFLDTDMPDVYDDEMPDTERPK